MSSCSQHFLIDLASLTSLLTLPSPLQKQNLAALPSLLQSHILTPIKTLKTKFSRATFPHPSLTSHFYHFFYASIFKGLGSCSQHFLAGLASLSSLLQSHILRQVLLWYIPTSKPLQLEFPTHLSPCLFSSPSFLHFQHSSFLPQRAWLPALHPGHHCC